MVKCFRLQIVLAGLLLSCFSAWAAPKFTASLDRREISLGESVTLSLSFEEGSPGSQPALPAIANLEYGGTGMSQQTIINNGQVTSQVVYTIEVHPTKEGNYVIPPITVDVNGNRLASAPIRLRVLKGSVPHPPGTPEPAFVKIIVPKTEVYLGEVLPVEIQCYCQNAAQVQAPQLTADGFTIGTMPEYRQRPPRVNINNTVYNMLTFRFPAAPTKTGNLTLGPANWSLTILSGPQDIFGNFHESHPVTVTSDAPEIRVLPVPTNDAPADFTGAVGRFSLAQYEAGPLNVAVGDPITLKIRITGQGGFDTVTLAPDQKEWREFTTYPPTSKLETSDPMQVDGSKYFEQVIAPQNAEIKEIPAFSFIYFDPATKSFHTISHPPIPLTVRPAAAAAQPTIISAAAPSSSEPPPAQEIVHIKSQLGTVGRPGPPLIRQPGFLALQCLAPLGWIAALLWRRQKDKLANNPRLRRRRAVARIVASGLAELPGHAQANRTEEFYATVFRLLQEQLGERLDLPASAITEAVLEEHLLKNLKPETDAALRELFHACNQYRYTPDRTVQEMTSLTEKLRTALRDLQNLSAPKAAKNLSAVACFLICLFAVSARAEDVAASFNEANKLYEEGHFTESAEAYQKIIQAGSVSPTLYFNLGNAWFKAGQSGRAIAAYRQAEILAPRDPDIRANLQFARNQIGGAAPGLSGNRWTRWIGRLTLNEWTEAASAVVFLFFLTLIARQIWPNLRKSSSFLALLALASVWMMVCVSLAAENRLSEKPAVVVVPEAVVRLGPLEEAQSAFTVRDGAELEVVDQKADWLQVMDAARRAGWLPQKDVAQIP